MVTESILALNEVPFRSVELDSRLFTRCSPRVGRNELANSLPLASSAPSVSKLSADSVHLTQAYSIAFQLLGMAEQNAADQFRKAIERQSGTDALPALCGDSLKQLKELGWTSEQIAKQLPRMQVELVLTAHPTEAKRSHGLAHHRRLFERFKLTNRAICPPTQGVLRLSRIQSKRNDYAVRALLSILWRTGEIYLDKPDIQSERRNVLDYLTHVFPSVLRPLDQRLRRAWTDAGWTPSFLMIHLSFLV